jgi:hypothetical protein
MTIVYLGELRGRSMDFVNALRGDDQRCFYLFTSAYQMMDWAEDASEIVVLYESEYAREAAQLKGRFAVVERKPVMSDDEVLDALEEAIQKLPPRILH